MEIPGNSESELLRDLGDGLREARPWRQLSMDTSERAAKAAISNVFATVRCGDCGAPGGQLCVDSEGTELTWPHASRVRSLDNAGRGQQ